MSTSPSHSPTGRVPWQVLALCCIWALMLVAAWPTGDFPLNDDWSYGLAVKSLVEDGRLRLSGWTSMPLIAQVLWGALFCLETGFSFCMLRCSTQVAALAGVLTLYALLREMRASRNVAFFGAALLATNPIYVALSNTFMTDVPFLAVSSLSMLCLVRGALTRERPSKGLIILGLSLAWVASFVRQAGAVIPMGVAMLYLVQRGFSARRLVVALSPVALVAGCLVLYEMVLSASIGLPALYHARSRQALVTLCSANAPVRIVEGVGLNLLYLGLFLLPFCVLVLPQHWRRVPVGRRRAIGGAATVLILGIVGYLGIRGYLMPLQGNVLSETGIGPVRLFDETTLGLRHLPRASGTIRWAATIAAVVGAVCIVFQTGLTAVGQRRDRRATSWRGVGVLLGTVGVLYAIPLSLAGTFDRYTLFLLPWTTMLLVPARNDQNAEPARWAWGLAGAWLVGTALFSAAGTHDYMAWNRARWLALDDLVEGRGISFARIDGGFEFNGLYGYAPDGDRPVRDDARMSWWWVRDNEYVVTFGPVDGYRQVARYPYRRWLPWGQGAIHVLRRDGM